MRVIDAIAYAKKTDTYFDFSNGLKLSDVKIEEFIEECIKECLRDFQSGKHSNKTFHSMSTGNTKVFVEAYRYDACTSFNVSITDSYKSKSLEVMV